MLKFILDFIDLRFFITLQVIILFLYYLNRNKEEFFDLRMFFQSRTHFLIMNICVIISCVYLNAKMQLFCIPVTWTLIILGAFYIAFLSLPFTNKTAKMYMLILGLTGIGFFISIYIILFGRFEYFIFMLFNIIPILIISLIIKVAKRFTKQSYFKALWFYGAFILTPYFMLYQLILIYKSLQTQTHKIVYLSTSILMLLIGIASTYQINQLINKINTAKDVEIELKEQNKNPINRYLTELILGAHWKYHTELCMYDGDRPPFHDPILVISNKILFPFEHFGNETKIPVFYDRTLYKKLYPNNETLFNCSCAAN